MECKAKKTGEFDAEDQDEVAPINLASGVFRYQKSMGLDFLQQKNTCDDAKEKQNSLRSPFK